MTANPTPQPAIPCLTSGPGPAQLIVDGSPFLVLGGELHNSATSTTRAIHTAFESLRHRNFNTVLAPVAWDTIEPQEGQYDFRLVDELLAVSRQAGVRLIPLWFGTWKNGRSTYVPPWVRKSVDRFPRASLSSSGNREHISPFSTAIRDADARAFSALMKHLREVDSESRTVIMVQVQNEVGILGDSRDRSRIASQQFEAQVPNEVFAALEADTELRLATAWEEQGGQTRGNWADIFGDSTDTDEAFMAVAYAAHVEAVVKAGKAEYPLPMFANAWLYTDTEVSDPTVAGGQTPGIYPSGGPLPHVAGLWRYFAPSLDLIVPDIYFGDFGRICSDYVAASGGLFIPEMRRDEHGAADAFLAIGNHGAIGVSPFGVDSALEEEQSHLSDAYRMLDAVAPLIRNNAVIGLHLNAQTPDSEFQLGDYIISAQRQPGRGTATTVERGYGLIIQIGSDEIVAVGRGLHLNFRTVNDGAVEFERLEELTGKFPDVEVTRRLNGDETHSGSTLILGALDVPVGKSYQIPLSPPGRGVLRAVLFGGSGVCSDSDPTCSRR